MGYVVIIPEILSRKETAKFIGVCLATLDGLDIPRTKVGNRVFYKRLEVSKWLDNNTAKKRSKT